MPATIALLRPAPRPGDVDGNKRSIERPVLVCTRTGARCAGFRGGAIDCRRRRLYRVLPQGSRSGVRAGRLGQPSARIDELARRRRRGIVDPPVHPCAAAIGHRAGGIRRLGAGPAARRHGQSLPRPAGAAARGAGPARRHQLSLARSPHLRDGGPRARRCAGAGHRRIDSDFAARSRDLRCRRACGHQAPAARRRRAHPRGAMGGVARRRRGDHRAHGRGARARRPKARR